MEDTLQNIWVGTIGAGAYCYNGSSFTNFTSADGLGDNEVECMFLDNVGNIWFGTDAGVSCYNGKSFRNFTVADGLADTDVHTIAQDKKGHIWIGSTGGISIFDGNTIQPFNNAAGQPFVNVRTIIMSRNGDVWFGGNDGLNRYDGNEIVNLMTDFVGYLYEDKKGDIWISAESGANPGSWTLYRCPSNTYPMVAGAGNFTAIKTEKGMIFGLCEDSSGKIWYGTLGGVCCYDGESFNYFEDKGE